MPGAYCVCYNPRVEMAGHSINHGKEILRGLGALAVGAVLFLPSQMLFMIQFIIVRAALLDIWGAMVTPAWGNLEHMLPESKVQIVSGRSEVAGTLADGLMFYYTIRIPNEMDHRAFDAMLEKRAEKDWYEEGSYTLNYNLSPANPWQRSLQVTVTPKADGCYELRAWDH